MKLHVKLSTILSISIILIVSISYIFNYVTIYNSEYHSRDIVLMVTISVISILAIIITNTLIIKELTSRITILLEQVQWISKGNFGSTIHIEKTDEISKLGRSINQLSLSLLQLKISHVEKENKLHYQSSHDHLTGLANRTYLYNHLMEIKEAGQQATIIIYDIDGFKGLNDLLGEKAGDSLLSAVGKKIQKIAASHFVARISGDEFAVVVIDIIDNDHINQLVEEIKWHTQKPITLEGEEIRVSLSGGISKYDAIEQDIESSLTHAALALMEAKRKGRGEVVNYDRSMSLLSSEQIEIENRLYQAVKNKEIYLEYQPKVSVNSGKIVGVEALARWKDAKLGIIPPNRFIPIAEEKGLILEITKQILFEACKQAKIWNTQGRFIPVSVNFSPVIFNINPHVDTLISEMIIETGLNPGLLEIEITEGVLLSKNSVSILERICRLGVSIAVDDFGTGYSSLGYLQSFPIHALKIDKSFIQIINPDFTNKELTQSILYLGKSLGLQVVAEGVETEWQYQFLMDQGCDVIQGYYISEPLQTKDIRTFIEQKDKSVV